MQDLVNQMAGFRHLFLARISLPGFGGSICRCTRLTGLQAGVQSSLTIASAVPTHFLHKNATLGVRTDFVPEHVPKCWKTLVVLPVASHHKFRDQKHEMPGRVKGKQPHVATLKIPKNSQNKDPSRCSVGFPNPFKRGATC